MEKLIHGIIVALVCISPLSAFSSTCDNKLETFLRSPTKANYILIVGSSRSEAARYCWPVNGMNQKNRDDLTGLVAGGNYWAIQFVAINIKTLDGGELEDALRILGEASHSAPELLLSLNADGTITDYVLSDAVTMLPERFVDKKYESINELKRRAKSLKSVHNNKFLRQRSFVLKQLSDALQELKKVDQSKF